MNEFFEYDQEEAILKYQLYENFVNLTRRFEKFYSLKPLIQSDFAILKPQFFVLEKEKNKKIEEHIQKILKEMNINKLKKSINLLNEDQNSKFDKNGVLNSSPLKNNKLNKQESTVNLVILNNTNNNQIVSSEGELDDQDEDQKDNNNKIIQYQNHNEHQHWQKRQFVQRNQDEQLTINFQDDDNSRRASTFDVSELNKYVNSQLQFK